MTVYFVAEEGVGCRLEGGGKEAEKVNRHVLFDVTMLLKIQKAKAIYQSKRQKGKFTTTTNLFFIPCILQEKPPQAEVG